MEQKFSRLMVSGFDFPFKNGTIHGNDGALTDNVTENFLVRLSFDEPGEKDIFVNPNYILTIVFDDDSGKK